VRDDADPPSEDWPLHPPTATRHGIDDKQDRVDKDESGEVNVEAGHGLHFLPSERKLLMLVHGSAPPTAHKGSSDVLPYACRRIRFYPQRRLTGKSVRPRLVRRSFLAPWLLLASPLILAVICRHDGSPSGLLVTVGEALKLLEPDQLDAITLRQFDKTKSLELAESAAHGLDGQAAWQS